MKRAAAVILAAMVTATMFAACASDKPAEQSTTAAEQSATEQATEKATEAPEEPYKETHTLYFKDSANGSGATATFFNSVSGKSEDVKMTKLVPRSAVLLCFRIMICPLRITCRLHEGSVFDTIREDNTDRIILYKVR